MAADIRLGAKEFKKFHANEKELFNILATGQSPEVLFITCADSRVDPNLLTNTKPGDLFVIRSAGNLLPRHPQVSGETASLEYAMNALPIKEVVICGHSSCGAMGGLMAMDQLEKMPLVSGWLEQATEVLSADLPNPEITNKVDRVALANVCQQIENLLTHPYIKTKVDAGQLKLTGWFFAIGSGEVLEWDGKVFKALNS